MSASPTRSPVVFARASACSTTSGVVNRSWTRISPSRRRSAAMTMLCSRAYGSILALRRLRGGGRSRGRRARGDRPPQGARAAPVLRRRRRRVHAGAAFVRMLPESAHVPHAFLFVLVGYFGVHLFEHPVAPHFHFGEEVHPEAPLDPAAGWLALLGLGVRTFVDGVSIHAGFKIGQAL